MWQSNEHCNNSMRKHLKLVPEITQSLVNQHTWESSLAFFPSILFLVLVHSQLVLVLIFFPKKERIVVKETQAIDSVNAYHGAELLTPLLLRASPS
jgi:anaerobic C4-dicarboxylate transporter